jgi:hypothetical protein
MLLPAFGFAFAVGVFSLLGWVVLSIRRKGELTLRNLGLFVAGGVGATLGAAWLYGRLLADENHLLQSRSAVLGLFPCLLIAGATGGLCLVLVPID